MVQRCARCLLPRNFPGADFDETGVCALCRDFRPHPSLGERALKEVLRGGKSEGRYDVCLGISGGKDSCYVAYYARRKLGLRALGIFYDFPFMVDLARENVARVCEALKMDLKVVRLERDVERRVLKNHLRSLSPLGVTWGQCLFCHYGIDAALYGIARLEGIPFVLGGVMRHEKWKLAPRGRYIRARLAKASWGDRARFAFFQAWALWGLARQRRQLPLPGNGRWNVLAPPRIPSDGPVFLSFFDYVPWDGPAMEKALAEETGWRKPAKALSWRYDCILEPLLDLTYLREFGVSASGLYLSGLVREGILGREEALSLLERSEGKETLREAVQRVCAFLGLSPSVESGFQAAVGKGGEADR